MFIHFDWRPRVERERGRPNGRRAFSQDVGGAESRSDITAGEEKNPRRWISANRRKGRARDSLVKKKNPSPALLLAVKFFYEFAFWSACFLNKWLWLAGFFACLIQVCNVAANHVGSPWIKLELQFKILNMLPFPSVYIFQSLVKANLHH